MIIYSESPQNNPDKIKYYIHDAIKAVLPDCKTLADLRFALKELGIELEYKFKRGTNQIEGVSLRYNDIAFKGSQIDRKFSYRNLKKQFDKNILEERKRGQKEYLQQQAEQKAKQQAQELKVDEAKASQKAKEEAVVKPKNPAIGGIQLNAEQWQTLKEGGFIYLENMNKKDGSGKFSAYVFLNDEKSKALFCDKNPEEFIEYGKYEMRIRDKILIEKGYVAKAKVKWYGMDNFAYPYLWKENKADAGYKESWSDPGLPGTQKEEQKPRQPIIPKKNRGQKR